MGMMRVLLPRPSLTRSRYRVPVEGSWAVPAGELGPPQQGRAGPGRGLEWHRGPVPRVGAGPAALHRYHTGPGRGPLLIPY